MCYEVFNKGNGRILWRDLSTGNGYVVLYGCETWSLILREEIRLRVLENRDLRRIFGPEE
jgi:hypothetical protein